MMLMSPKRLAALIAASCTGLATVSAVQAQVTTAEKTAKIAEAEVDSEVVTVTGEVVAVDAASRTVSIKRPQGNVVVYRVDPKVKNLEQVKVGDRTRVDYKMGFALALKKGGDGIREKVEAESAAMAPEGAKPSIAAMKRTTVVANVLSVNKTKKIATLEGPEGNVVDVMVRDPQVLQEVEAGDQVVAVVTESMAVNVRPANAAAMPAAKPASQ